MKVIFVDSGEPSETTIKMVVVVENAGEPFEDDIDVDAHKDFDYGCFSSVEGQRGVYVFQHKSTGQVLYVGSGGFSRSGKRWDLADRVKQHYRARDTSQNFLQNWARTHCGECKDQDSCSRTEVNCVFREYLELISQSRVIFFCIDSSGEQKEANELEKCLGRCFRSKYSSH